jgi:hypothetical protein
MIAVWVALFALAVIVAVLVQGRRLAAAAVVAKAARQPRKPTPAAPIAKPAAAPAVAKPVADAGFEWEDPIVAIAASGRESGALAILAPPDQLRAAQRARIRDRYLAARFPGVARSVADLRQPERVIEAARLYFEERKLDRAIELLGLAIDECPGEESIALARLEIAFLKRDPALYAELAGAFRGAHGASAQWAEVARLGRALAPEEAMFGAAQAPRASDHYGPWPDMPNWIRAPWDLTAEVRATEFHQAMDRQAA